MPCWTLFTSASRSVPVKEAGRGEGCDECPVQHCRRTVVCRLSSQARQQGYLIFLNLNTSQCKKKNTEKNKYFQAKVISQFLLGSFQGLKKCGRPVRKCPLKLLAMQYKTNNNTTVATRMTTKNKTKKNRTGS